jgi:CheY-like chemotaxis protein
VSCNNTILLVEDLEEDAFLLQYAFKRAAINNPVQVATDGQHAIDYLSGHDRFADREKHPLPCLILLDLKLPLKMGLEVLEWIRGQPPPVKHTIVIVLSSSVHEGDIARAYELGANAFLVKPSSSAILAQMCAALKLFWLVHNDPPIESFVR